MMKRHTIAAQGDCRRLEGTRKIAILRANSLGDYIFTLPALEALDNAYPEAEIVLLGKPWHAGFLTGRPGPVDRVIALPYLRGICEIPGGRENPGETDALLGALRRERFDICCQLYGGGRFSNPFVARIGARLTIGMKAADAARTSLDRWVPYIYYFPEVARYLEVARLAGAEPVTHAPRLLITAGDIDEAGTVFPLRRRFAVLHPGATDARRQWPAEKFAQTGTELIRKGVPVCITGSGNEAGICSRIDALLGHKAVNLYGRLSLRGLAGLLSKAAVVVSNDTGPLHLARAVGTPTVAVYWVGNYINAGPPDMERHRSHISWRLECPTCGTNCIDGSCIHRASFVADVPVRPVVRSCLELLALPSGEK